MTRPYVLSAISRERQEILPSEVNDTTGSKTRLSVYYVKRRVDNRRFLYVLSSLLYIRIIIYIPVLMWDRPRATEPRRAPISIGMHVNSLFRRVI